MNAVAVIEPARVGKLLRLALSATESGEVLGAIAAIKRTLTTA